MGSINVGGFTLDYEKKNAGVTILGCKGTDSRLKVPEAVTEGESLFPVKAIDKKAFLGLKGLREISVPGSVTEIGDWAFSQCIHLSKITIPGDPSKILFGRAVFEGCERLEQVFLGADCDEGTASLLAAVVWRLPAQYLQRDPDIGSAQWYRRFDLALMGFLHQEDIEGYSNAALCGEEDISYDGIGSVDGELLGENAAYLRGVSKNKCYLCLLRLKNDVHLSASDREFLEGYVKARSIGHKNEASWLVLKEDFKDNLDYFKLYLDIVKPDTKGFDAMLSDLKEDMAEVRAFLIKAGTKETKEDDFFAGLMI